jgi:catechol 2,3-dioxygenase-like lactoylglutathione lyase family enzyme
VGIHEVIIEVGDIAEAVEFYTKVVGLKLVRIVEEGGAKAAELDADGQRVSLVASGGPGVRFALRTTNVRAERRRLGRHSVEPVPGEPVEAAGGAWLGFTDPWGNRLGYWQESQD